MSVYISKGNRFIAEREIDDGLIAFPVFSHHHLMERKRRKLLSTDLQNQNPNSSITFEFREDVPPKNVVEGNLYQGFGTHYVDLWVGSPIPQRQTVIVDTGSQITAFPCNDCKISSLNGSHQCGQSYHVDSNFNESKSSTFHSVSCQKCSYGFCSKRRKDTQCQIHSSYSEGSGWSAYEAIDRISLRKNDFFINEKDEDGNTTTNTTSLNSSGAFNSSYFDLRFACQTKITGLFKTQIADGIMGLSNERNTFWHQMYQAGMLSRKQFSLCYAPKQPSFKKYNYNQTEFSISNSALESEGSEIPNAGYVTFGGVKKNLLISPIVFAKMYSSIFYTVKLKSLYFLSSNKRFPTLISKSKTTRKPSLKINFDGSQINSSGEQKGFAIVDSGTTETYIDNIKDKFQEAWKDITGFDYLHEYEHMTEEQLSLLPTLLLQVQGDVESNKRLFDQNTEQFSKQFNGHAGPFDANNPFDIIIVIPPEHYIEYSKTHGKFITRIVLISSSSGNNNILGSNTIQGHNVLFDIENKRIGWGESPCNYSEMWNMTHFSGTFESLSSYSSGCKCGVDQTVGLCKVDHCTNLFWFIAVGLFITIMVILWTYRYALVKITHKESGNYELATIKRGK